jgi:hypothetical protein
VNRGNQELFDENEGLIRRVWWTPGKYKPIVDQKTGRQRAPAAAFEPRLPDSRNPSKKVDKALSVNVESSLMEASLPLTWGVDPNKQYAARITVLDCHSNELRAFCNPLLPSNPHHGLIFGLVEMSSNNPDLYEQTIDALARASTLIL